MTGTNADPVRRSSGEAPAFSVLDVVRSLVLEDQGGLGVVTAVRHYTAGGYGYDVAPLLPDDEVVGGIYAEAQLARQAIG